MDLLNKIEVHDYNQATTINDHLRALIVVLSILEHPLNRYNKNTSNARRYLEWLKKSLNAGDVIAATDAAVLSHCFLLWRSEIDVVDAMEF